MELALKLLGILFGVLARTLAPYLRKLKRVTSIIIIMERRILKKA